jgi:hypothetical protein
MQFFELPQILVKYHQIADTKLHFVQMLDNHVVAIFFAGGELAPSNTATREQDSAGFWRDTDVSLKRVGCGSTRFIR